MTERYIYRCAACGNAGETFLADASHDGEAAACATCGGPVTLARDDGLPTAFDTKRQPAREIGVRASSTRCRRPEDKLDPRRLLPWFEDLMWATFWWESTGVEPEQAARVLWHINPLDEPEGAPTRPEDNRAYRAMLHEFMAIQKAEPRTRRLAQWLDIARQKRLRYNSWIDDWLQARTASREAAGAAHWTVLARQIADELDRKDEKTGACSSLFDMAGRVAEIAAERKIAGPQGPLTRGNILREALQGGRWTRPRKAKTGK